MMMRDESQSALEAVRYGSPHLAAFRKDLSRPVITTFARSATVAASGKPQIGAVPSPLDHRDWPELLNFVDRERIAAVFADAVDTWLPATEAQRAAAGALRQTAMMGDLFIESVLMELAEIFDQGGIN